MSVCLWGYLACVHLHQSLHNPVTQRPPLPPHIPTNIKSHRVEGSRTSLLLAGLSVSHRTLAEEKSLLHSSVVVLYAYAQAENRARERGNRQGWNEIQWWTKLTFQVKPGEEEKRRQACRTPGEECERAERRFGWRGLRTKRGKEKIHAEELQQKLVYWEEKTPRRHEQCCWVCSRKEEGPTRHSAVFHLCVSSAGTSLWPSVVWSHHLLDLQSLWRPGLSLITPHFLCHVLQSQKGCVLQFLSHLQ